MSAILSGSTRLRYALALGARAWRPGPRVAERGDILGRHVVAERRHVGVGVGLDRGFALTPGPSPRGEKGAGFFVRGWGEMAELAGSARCCLGCENGWHSWRASRRGTPALGEAHGLSVQFMLRARGGTAR